MQEAPSFFEQVYALVRRVPPGRVTTYGAIAAYLAGASARAVGWALRQSGHGGQPVPAHRVVNRHGVLTGKHFFPTPDLMQRLLESEGIAVENDRVVDFERLFWDPSSA